MKKEVNPKIKGLALLTFISLFALFLTSFVSADTVLNKPAASTTTGGSNVELNVSTNDVFTTATNLVNITFYAKSASTANSSWTVLATILNYNVSLSSNNTRAFANLTSGVLEDANDYIFNVTVRNATALSGEDTNTAITVDTGVPTAPTSLTPTSLTTNETSGSKTFSSTVNNPSTISCTYTIGRGGTSSSSSDTTFNTAATYSASTCSFTKTFSTSSDNGDWYWYITASDGTNTTVSATNIVTVSIAGGGSGGNAYLQQQVLQQQQSPGGEGYITTPSGKVIPKKTLTVIIIGAVVFIFIAVFVVVMKPGSKRRRR